MIRYGTQRMEKLNQDTLDQRLGEFEEWSLSGDAIQRTFSFDDFNAAMAFVNRIAELAESIQHHPDIMVRYNKVTLMLTTHDAGGVTERDFNFAREIDAAVTR